MLLHPKLKALTEKIRDEKLRKKVVELLENPTFKVNKKEYSGLPLEVSPAGLSHHHSYPGGYIEHVLSTANLALALCNSVEKIYHGKVNRDLVIAGVLLHDLFKPLTYAVKENGTYDSTFLAEYLDHLSLAVSELVRRDFPLDLIHTVCAHHGDYGPIKPHTIEALICHLADLTDSRLNGQVLNAAAYLARKATGEELQGLNSKEAFEIVHSKAVEGWEGVAKTVERIKRRRKLHKT
ncbi:dihydroneopterin 2',3'-cyclic phosphate phosphodiesterase [Candidatus Bathyarchaeota archaeon]|nr:HDIG domain-containing protein [Candidatus Bathyarchaeota archaeon]RLI22197.1 MAG: dihydroneopterin 2',3'-cyclic phosphate phosphodiesterase [Candidatus Bathyarchaeota archaeon]RLI41867.1 MAG: dihydroneopterin 2',3'-cyclic phosphate phosphodiesterase [Candidatus Bathyarchaeota archaeon]